MNLIEDSITFLISRSAKQLADTHDKLLMAEGITRTQWTALYFIHQYPSIPQKELAALLGSQEPTIVRLLDRMVKEGLVIRVQRNRRTNHISMTEKGELLYEKGYQITSRYKEAVMKHIPDDDLETFQSVLNQLVENAKQLQ